MKNITIYLESGGSSSEMKVTNVEDAYVSVFTSWFDEKSVVKRLINNTFSFTSGDGEKTSFRRKNICGYAVRNV